MKNQIQEHDEVKAHHEASTKQNLVMVQDDDNSEIHLLSSDSGLSKIINNHIINSNSEYHKFEQSEGSGNGMLTKRLTTENTIGFEEINTTEEHQADISVQIREPMNIQDPESSSNLKFETQKHIRQYIDNLDSNALNSPDAEGQNEQAELEEFKQNNANYQHMLEQVRRPFQDEKIRNKKQKKATRYKNSNQKKMNSLNIETENVFDSNNKRVQQIWGIEGEKFKAGSQVVSDLIDLYLSVKIRKNEEIDDYNDDFHEKERQALIADGISPCTLVRYIKSSVEILMSLKYDNDNKPKPNNCPNCNKDEAKPDKQREISVKSCSIKDSVVSIPYAPKEYEDMLIQLEADIRSHIQCEQQLQLHIEVTQDKYDQVMEQAREQMLKRDRVGKQTIELLEGQVEKLEGVNKKYLDLNKNLERKLLEVLSEKEKTKKINQTLAQNIDKIEKQKVQLLENSKQEILQKMTEIKRMQEKLSRGEGNKQNVSEYQNIQSRNNSNSAAATSGPQIIQKQMMSQNMVQLPKQNRAARNTQSGFNLQSNSVENNYNNQQIGFQYVKSSINQTFNQQSVNKIVKTQITKDGIQKNPRQKQATSKLIVNEILERANSKKNLQIKNSENKSGSRTKLQMIVNGPKHQQNSSHAPNPYQMKGVGNIIKNQLFEAEASALNSRQKRNQSFTNQTYNQIPQYDHLLQKQIGLEDIYNQEWKSSKGVQKISKQNSVKKQQIQGMVQVLSSQQFQKGMPSAEPLGQNYDENVDSEEIQHKRSKSQREKSLASNHSNSVHQKNQQIINIDSLPYKNQMVNVNSLTQHKQSAPFIPHIKNELTVSFDQLPEKRGKNDPKYMRNIKNFNTIHDNQKNLKNNQATIVEKASQKLKKFNNFQGSISKQQIVTHSNSNNFVFKNQEQLLDNVIKHNNHKILKAETDGTYENLGLKNSTNIMSNYGSVDNLNSITNMSQSQKRKNKCKSQAFMDQQQAQNAKSGATKKAKPIVKYQKNKNQSFINAINMNFY